MQRLATIADNTGEAIGTALLPTVEKLASFLGDDVAPAVAGLVDVLDDVPAQVYEAVAAAVGLAVAVHKVNDVFGGFGPATRSAKLGLKDFAGVLGGPWGAAITGATIVTGIWIKSQIDAKQRIDDLSGALDADSGKLGENTREKVKNRLESEDLLKAAEALGIPLATVTDAALGNADALAEVHRVTGDVIGSTEAMTEQVRGGSTDFSRQNKAAHELQDGLTGVNADLREAEASYKRQAEAAGTAATSGDKLKDAEDKLKTAQNAAKKAADEQWAALQKLSDQFLTGRASARSLKQAQADLTRSIKENGRTVNINTQAGRDNAEALDRTAQATRDDLKAHHDAGEPLKRYRKRVEEARDALIDEARKAGMSKTAAKKYADAILNVPTKQATKFETPGLRAAKQAIHNLEVQIKALKGKSLEVVIDSRGNALLHDVGSHGAAGTRGGVATGGYITGPGGPRDDRAGLFRLSNGEFVVNAAATGQHRQLLEAINAGHVGAMARGGLVDQVRVHGTAHMPPASWTAQLLRRIDPAVVMGMGGGAMGGINAGFTGGSGTARWRGTVLAALAMLGEPSVLAGSTLRRMNQESGGNPAAINRWDVNWQRGTPSVGLMQVIGPTYARWHHPGVNRPPFAYGTSEDPLSNILASMRYARGVYGSLSRAYNRSGGYDRGGIMRGAGVFAKLTQQPERILSPAQTARFDQALARPVGAYGAAAPVVHIHVDAPHLLGGADLLVKELNTLARRGQLTQVVRLAGGR